jgi:hypothetical protein
VLLSCCKAASTLAIVVVPTKSRAERHLLMGDVAVLYSSYCTVLVLSSFCVLLRFGQDSDSFLLLGLGVT